ncbi:hypothetical protein BC835DRAFT_1306289 [Cytidiella melzeri]|nr:hypothetical protein BC835DRAFT_1306289 [Cytidiella melzeri]
MFERWKGENKEQHQNKWYPFGSKDEWEMAAWLAQNVGHNKIDEFLKLEMIKKCGLTATSKYMFFKKIDQLPRRPGMKWTCDTVSSGQEIPLSVSVNSLGTQHSAEQ